jgi:hypothetical protein
LTGARASRPHACKRDHPIYDEQSEYEKRAALLRLENISKSHRCAASHGAQAPFAGEQAALPVCQPESLSHYFFNRNQGWGGILSEIFVASATTELLLENSIVANATRTANVVANRALKDTAKISSRYAAGSSYLCRN